MTRINVQNAAHDALTALQSVEAAFAADLPAAHLFALQPEHHDYLRVAQALEGSTATLARALTALAKHPDTRDTLRSLADSRATWLMHRSARCGEAWTLYESLIGQPTEVIVLELCEAGYCDHARFVVTGRWNEAEEGEAHAA